MKMDFKASFERYRAGTASAEETDFVKNELEKYELIEEYFSDLSEETVPEEEHTDEEAATFAKKIKKKTNRRFRNVGLITGLILLVLVLFFTFGLSPFVDLLYYNPAEVLDEEGIMQRIALDMDIYTELNSQRHVSFATAEAEGFGKYRIYLSSIELFSTGNFDNPNPVFSSSKVSAAFIDKGNYRLYDPSFNFMSSSVFLKDSSQYSLYDSNTDVISTYNEDMLNRYYANNSYIPVLICFNEEISINEIIAFHQKYNLKSPYYGVKVSDETDTYPHVLNFKAVDSVSSMTSIKIDEDQKYPMLRQRTSDGAFNAYDPSRFDYNEIGGKKERFLSMLDYMADQRQFLKMMGDDPAVYRAAHEYVEENGLQFLTINGYVSRADVERMLRDKTISTISISEE